MRWHQAREVLRLVVMGSVFSVSTASLADVNEGFLRVPSMGILVEELDEQAAACGVTKGGLDGAVRLTLDASRVPIQEGLLTPNVYVNVTVLRAPDGCLASVHIAFNRILQLPGGHEKVYGAEVWQNRSLLAGPRYDFPQRVYSDVEGFTKELIAEWLKANPR